MVSFRKFGVMRKLLIISIVLVLLLACTKKPDPVSEPKSEDKGFMLMFDNYVNSDKLIYDKYYLNENKDSFKVSAFKYYISNISLKSDDGHNYIEEESYHLIDNGKDSSKIISLKGVKAGSYIQVQFLIGVDSARNVSGAQTGALDPNNAMFWDWNTGYIMAKIEGYSPQASKYPNNLALHIAGFKHPNSVLRWVTLSLPTVKYAENQKVTVHIKTNLAEWFRTPNLIKFSDLSIVASEGKEAQKIADNYADMFSIDHID
jgi:hypothetical protein